MSNKLIALQNLYYDRLGKLISFLDSNNIKYFAAGGTLLGAIRHGEFIPWDDDIDLGMDRENFDKFIELASKLDSKYFYVVGFPFSKKIEHGLIKVALKNSVRKNSNLLKGYDRNFHIDIFPYDYVTNDLKQRTKDEKIIEHYKKILYYKSRDKSSTFFKTILLRILQMFLYPISSIKIAKKMNEIAKSHFFEKNSCDFLVSTNGLYGYEKEMISKKSICSFDKAKFGPLNINIPRNANDFLRQLYGNDFMTPKNLRNVDDSVILTVEEI